MNYLSVIYFAVVVILILFIIGRLSPKGFIGSSRNVENFDTYWNHSMGAQHQFELSDMQDATRNLRETERLAKYTWNEQDKSGLKIYDKYYEDRVQNINYPTEDDTYVERELLSSTDGYLDSKFEVLPVSSNYSSYELAGMADPNPVFTEANGEFITLSQKNF